MQLRLLGPVDLICDGRQVGAGPAKQRCVLAALGLSAGTTIPVDSVIDHVWGDSPPRDVRSALYTYIARIRRLLTEHAPAGDDSLLQRSGSGYILGISRENVDALRFRDLLETTRHDANAAERRTRLIEALEMWRGAPLSGLEGEWAAGVRTRFEQLRLDALTERIDLDLDAGAGAELADELTRLVAENPLAEHFTGQLMRALCAGGRRAEALDTFQQLRARLIEELGVGPGGELDRLHQDILRGEPVVTATVKHAPAQDVPHELPAAPATFVDREDELDTVVGELTREPRNSPAVVAVYGSGGVGKSALALQAAHAVGSHYPDGQLYVDLQGSSPGLEPLHPGEVLGRFLRALGVASAGIPSDTGEAAGQLRSLLAEKRMLVMLDNAADSAQVRPLIPSSPECAVLVTSRSILTGLDNARHTGLDILPADRAAALLAALDTTGRLEGNAPQAREIAALCGHLPLALRIIAARMASRPQWPVEQFTDRLQDERHRLDQLGRDDVSIRSCFEVSYQALERSADPVDKAAARGFLLLGLPDGADISLPVAARLLDVPDPQAETILDRLVDTQLLTSHTPGRFRMHDLLRLYARERAAKEMPEQSRYAALDRTWRCYVATSAAGRKLMRPGFREDLVKVDATAALPLSSREQAVTWLTAERTNLLAAAGQAAHAANDFSRTTIDLAFALFVFLYFNTHWSDLKQINEQALEVAQRLGDRNAEGQLLSNLGVAASALHDFPSSIRLLEESLEVRREVGDKIGEAGTLHNLASKFRDSGEKAKARETYEAALQLREAVGDRSGAATTTVQLAEVNRSLGDHDMAVEQLTDGLRTYRELGDSVGEAFALRTLGDSFLDQERLAESIDCYEQALQISRDLGLVASESWNLGQLGEAHRRTGDLSTAVELCEEALRVSRESRAQHEQARALWRLGSALADSGVTGRAVELWREALPIFERIGTAEQIEITRLLESHGAR